MINEVLLRQQKRKQLAAEYKQRAAKELEEANLPAALDSYANALELDPSDQEARDGLRKLEALMGDEYAEAWKLVEDEGERAVVRRAQALLEAEAFSNRGDLALREGDYDRALEEYRQAQIILAYNPYIATDSLDEEVIGGKVEEASRLRAEAAAENERLEREAAAAERVEAEKAQRELRENKLREYYRLANEAFRNEKFSVAESWCSQILLADPGNESARELQSIAREARHSRADEVYRRNYREQWLRTMDELDSMDIPQTSPLEFNDLKRWAEVSQRVPLEHATMEPEQQAERQEVRSRLDSVRFVPRFRGQDGEGSPLDEVASYLQRLTGVNFWISSKVTDELDEEETTINLDLSSERTVTKMLDLITEIRENLRWKIEDGIVKFVTKEELIGGQQLTTYSVQDLIHPIRDYPGGEINVSPSGGIEPPDEDLPEREANVVTPTLLEELIRNNIAVESWDEDPNNSIQITETGTLVVNQTPEVHAQIQELLADLREATGIMVDIQARFMKVQDDFLEDIGVDFRGLGQPGLGVGGQNFNDFGDPSTQADLGSEIGQGTDIGAFYSEGEDGDLRARVEELYDISLGNDQITGSGGLSFQWTFLNDLQLELILRAVEKSQRVELVTAPRITVHNASRANLSVMNQVAYVHDFDVEIAQAASIADPIIEVIQDGIILDVRPVVSADRRFLTLELRPTIAELQRPIAERVTTLGSQNSVTIQLPEVEIQRVRTTIPMPDGGTVLLGGRSISEKKNLRSGVPILNKIPILSALFERKGSLVSNRKLLILLNANIVIPSELEPTPAQMGLNE